MHCMVEGAWSCVGLSGGNVPPQLQIHASSDGPGTIGVTFSSLDFRPIFLSDLSSLIMIHISYHTQISSDCLVPFSYPLSPQSPINPCTIEWRFAYLFISGCSIIMYDASAHKAVVL